MTVVLDTNVLVVSGALLPDSIPGRVFNRAQLVEGLLFSEATFAELRTVLSRPKFQRYLDEGQRDRFLVRCLQASSLVEVARRVSVCRDPDDDKFLDVAVNGNAEFVVTGDADLLVLHPFETVAIISPADYLARGEA